MEQQKTITKPKYKEHQLDNHCLSLRGAEDCNIYIYIRINMFKRRVVKKTSVNKRQRINDETIPINNNDDSSVKPEINDDKKDENDNGSIESNETYLAKEKDEHTREIELRRKERLDLQQEVDEEIERQIKNKPSGFVKPISKNMKTVTVTDYQPDICKDFQKTGYCGYGDSCKFLHSRDDFAGGWKLNTDWQVDGSKEKELLDDLISEEIPFKCVVCEGEYKNPVKTKCNHYFCSSCFMNKMKTSTKCPVCGKETEGVAKMATNLKNLLKKK